MKKNLLLSILFLFTVSYSYFITDSNQTKIESNSDVIFSTQDLDSAKWFSPDEFPLKYIGLDSNVYNEMNPVIRLPDYKGFPIVISAFTEAGDDIPYFLCVVKSGIIMYDESLGISPRWSEPGNDENNYVYKKIIIYKDYIIRIDTEKKVENKEVKKFTKFYRINDKGDFYEVKIDEIK